MTVRTALAVIVLSGPLVDLATGYYQDILGNLGILSPGMLYRSVLVFPLITCLMLRTRNPEKLVAACIIVFYTFGKISWELKGYPTDSLLEFRRLSKLLFPIICAGALKTLVARSDDGQRLLWGSASLYGMVTVAGILGFAFTDLSIDRYGRYMSFATSGLFGGGNAVAVVLLITLPCVHYYIHRYRRSRVREFLVIDLIWFSAAFTLSSRAALLGIPFVMLASHLIIVVHLGGSFGPPLGKRVSTLFITLGLLILYARGNVYFRQPIRT